MIGAGLRRARFAVSLFAVMLLVSGCSAHDRTSAAASNAPAVTAASAVTEPPDTGRASASAAVAESGPMPESAAMAEASAGNEAAAPVEHLPVRHPIIAAAASPANKRNALDDRCNSDADCMVKDVGSCCGYRPACLNRDSPTFADAVKARCKAEGRLGVCGGIAVSGCQCSNGHCAAHALDNRVLLP